VLQSGLRMPRKKKIPAWRYSNTGNPVIPTACD